MPVKKKCKRLPINKRYENQFLDRETGHPITGICALCGCEDDNACEGGCCWVNSKRTLCSSCADMLGFDIENFSIE